MRNPLKGWDEKDISSFHWKTALVAGAGQFVDGYDLTAGALVFSLIEQSLGQGLAGASTILFLSIILGNAVGAVLFGYLARHGRKKFYGIDAALMTLGAIAQAFVTDAVELAVVRFLLGVGIGADYVLSPTITAEYANRRDRGKLMGVAGGLMWNVGALASTLVALAVVPDFPADAAWRLVLALGAVPALLVVYFRRRFPETPRYLLYIKGDVEGLRGSYGLNVAEAPRASVDWGKVAVPLFLAALAWYLYDIAAYAGVFFGPNVIAEKIGVNGIVFELIVLAGFTVPGNFISAMVNDRVGRRLLQAIGFAGMGVATLAFALYGLKGSVMAALLLFGLSSAMNSLGPGTIVGFWGAELFPTSIRGVTSGVTVIGGRLGVITTTLLVPVLLQAYGVQYTMVVLALVSFAGAGVTMALREPSQRSLDEFEFLEEMERPEFTE